LEVYDAVPLPRGAVLVACGESGAYLVDGSGATVAHFDAPAFELASSENGGRALAIARRGSVVQLARLDLGAVTSQSLGLYRLTTGTTEVRGSHWYAAEGSRLMGLDISGSAVRCFWEVDLLRPIRRVTLVEKHLIVETAGRDAECWHFDWPELVLRARLPADQRDCVDDVGFALSGVYTSALPPASPNPIVFGAASAETEPWDDSWRTFLRVGDAVCAEVDSPSGPRLRYVGRDLVLITRGAVGMLGLDGPRFRTVVPKG
jgi:hypothetical protein